MSAPTLPRLALRRDERELLAAVHRWARAKVGPDGAARWEPAWLASTWRRPTSGAATAPTMEVSWGDAAGGQLHVEVRASRYGDRLLDEWVTPRSVREAVDLLVTWRILPPEFHSLLRERRAPAGAGVS